VSEEFLIDSLRKTEEKSEAAQKRREMKHTPQDISTCE
jgi:hypothetical protein